MKAGGEGETRERDRQKLLEKIGTKNQKALQYVSGRSEVKWCEMSGQWRSGVDHTVLCRPW